MVAEVFVDNFGKRVLDEERAFVARSYQCVSDRPEFPSVIFSERHEQDAERREVSGFRIGIE